MSKLSNRNWLGKVILSEVDRGQIWGEGAAACCRVGGYGMLQQRCTHSFV